MTDIVERLRMSFSPTRDLKSTENNKLHKDAADEIERLREALKIFADNVKETNVGIDKNWAETVYALKAENQRLRGDKAELLKALTDLWSVSHWPDNPYEMDAAKLAIAKATGDE